MSFIKELRRYFFPPERPVKSVPRQMINDYDLRRANEQELMLMLANVARSPEAARELLDKYDCKTAAELLKKLPKRKKTTLRQRFIRLIRRYEMHQKGDPYRDDFKPEIHVEYRYKKRK